VNSKTEKVLKGLIREEYKRRLVEVLADSIVTEADVFDKRGNQLLSPGLKVRHKESGYEYTIDSVKGKGEDVEIRLRKPEVARFEPPQSQSELVEFDASKIDYGRAMGREDMGTIPVMKDKPASRDPVADDSPAEDEIVVVTKTEFEKEYEVD